MKKMHLSTLEHVLHFLNLIATTSFIEGGLKGNSLLS